jgi:hypothetical protein
MSSRSTRSIRNGLRRSSAENRHLNHGLLVLLMGDTVAKPMVAHITIDQVHLRWINEALVRRCERFAMSRSRALLESLLKATGI